MKKLIENNIAKDYIAKTIRCIDNNHAIDDINSDDPNDKSSNVLKAKLKEKTMQVISQNFINNQKNS